MPTFRFVRFAPVLAAVAALVTFTPRTSFAAWSLAQSVTLGSARGASFGDADGDGDPDLYVAIAFGGGSRLFRNDAGDFVDWAPAGFAPGNSFAGVWGDVDEDGDLDLYVTRTSGGNRLLRNDGAAGFADATNGLPLGITGTNLSPTWRDADRDGDLDLYIARGGGDRLLRNDLAAPGGAISFVDATPLVMDDLANTRTGIWGDFDADGDDDLYVVNSDGANRLLRNDLAAPGGAIAFADATAPPLDHAGDGRGAVAADFDEDGDLDLYVTNFLGPNVLLRNDGPAGFADATSGPLGDPSNSQSVAAEDFDLDGDLDVYIVNDGAANRLLRNDLAAPGGGFVFVDVASGPEADAGTGIGGAAADFDGDGDADLFVANSGVPSVFLSNDESSGRAFVQVDLVGGESNRSGIGARVRLVANGFARGRHVSAGSGSLSQSAATIGFGLGESILVDSLVVDWPSGAHQVVLPPLANTKIAVLEAEATAAPTFLLPPTSVARLVAHPTPAFGSVRLRFDGPRPLVDGVAHVVDAAGRSIARLDVPPSLRPGEDFSWNGRSEDGALVSAGVYFVRLVARTSSLPASPSESSVSTDLPPPAKVLLLR